MNSADLTGSKTRILLAEDGADHARIISAVLTKAGFELVHVQSGAEAYQLLKSGERFQLLLTDVLMPGMSGFELLTRLAQDGIRIPTVVLTAKRSEEDVLRGLNQGAIDYITKPFSPSVLLARVKLALQKSGSAAA